MSTVDHLVFRCFEHFFYEQLMFSLKNEQSKYTPNEVLFRVYQFAI